MEFRPPEFRGTAMTRAAAFSLTLLLGLSTAARACPNCKEAVAAQPSDVANMARGYNYSVMFMLVVPASMLGGGAFLVSRAAEGLAAGVVSRSLPAGVCCARSSIIATTAASTARCQSSPKRANSGRW